MRSNRSSSGNKIFLHIYIDGYWYGWLSLYLVKLYIKGIKSYHLCSRKVE